MRLMGLVVLGVMMVAPLRPSAAHSESYEHVRRGWLVGLGVGAGSAEFRGGAPWWYGAERWEGIAGSFRVGYAFQPQLSLELNSNAWTNLSGSERVLSVVTLALSYYPGASGLVLRSGVGVGNAEFSTQDGVSPSQSGLGLTAGVAYEFRAMPRFAVGPQFDFTWTDQGGFSTNHVAGGLGLTWYFSDR